MRLGMGAAMALLFSLLLAACGSDGGGGNGGGFVAATQADLENKSFRFPADQDLFDEDDLRFGQDATLTVGTFAGTTAAATITTINTLTGGTISMGSCTLEQEFIVVDGELEFVDPDDPDAVVVLNPCEINRKGQLRVTDDLGETFTSDPAGDPEAVFALDAAVTLSPENVVDPPVSLGDRPENGTGRVTIFSGSEVLNYTLVVNGLKETDTLTNAHIHEGDFEENGAPFIALVGDPGTGGVAFVESNGQLTASGAILLTETEAARLTDPADPFYLQIHSQEVPSGLLRGQIRGLNRLPVANAGPDQTVGVDALVTLNGSSSSDPDGDTVTYTWSFDSTPVGSTAALSDSSAVMPTFTADLEGDYVVQLIVSDGTVDSAPDTTMVTATSTVAAEGEQLYLDGQCDNCHGADGSGKSASNIQGITAQRLRQAERVGPTHDAFIGSWSDAEVQAVSDFLSSF